MSLHPTTFEYHKPTETQLIQMDQARAAAKRYYQDLEALLPDGPDKTYIFRELRGLAMWVNVALTRYADGVPRHG